MLGVGWTAGAIRAERGPSLPAFTPAATTAMSLVSTGRTVMQLN